MAASDHIHPYIKAYHISWDDTPPHELDPDKKNVFYQEGDNIHPDALHMGTREAAMQIWRTHLHEYEIDPSVMHPVIQGDSPSMMEKANQPGSYRNRDVNIAMSGVQPELWESVSADPREAVKTGKVLPYRNLAEAPGSISYIVPKSAIKEGKVRYVGVKDIQGER